MFLTLEKLSLYVNTASNIRPLHSLVYPFINCIPINNFNGKKNIKQYKAKFGLTSLLGYVKKVKQWALGNSTT